ncbi:uncharacterized protein LOC117160341 [Bombus vancouverensis nearcticus]|uniref:uncharacterized protein LOC117160341 n=1 Tax=Bombus vancouverensis nearcticus TaxID=2705178 RepID=UPI00402BCD53
MRGARAVKGLIDADSTAFIVTYTILKVTITVGIKTFSTDVGLRCAIGRSDFTHHQITKLHLISATFCYKNLRITGKHNSDDQVTWKRKVHRHACSNKRSCTAKEWEEKEDEGEHGLACIQLCHPRAVNAQVLSNSGTSINHYR